MRLLIVEDNIRLGALLARLLSTNGFAVDTVATAEEATAALGVAAYDLIVLDLALPDGNGTAILRGLRDQGHATPVLVATAGAALDQRIRTLNEGADDYLVKPFSAEELLARVRAILRRPRQLASEVLTLANLALDTAAMTLRIDNQPVELPRREYAVLAALMRSPDQLLAKRRLEDSVYTLDSEVTPNAIEAAVSRLRRRLEAHGAQVSITAMRGLGYVLANRPP